MSLIGSGARLDEKTTNHPNITGDHDVFAHYVTREDALRSAVEGTPIMAVCGKIWVPHRNPEAYPVCPTCEEIMSGVEID
jgi:hypothetical protein